MLRHSLAALLLVAPAVAVAGKPLTSGEFRNTAQTIEKGSFVLHPLFMPSGFGITDTVDLKFTALGLLAGPNASVEATLLDTDAFALSVEPSGSASWSLSTFAAGADVHTTVPLGDHRFNVSLGGGWSKFITVTTDDNGNILDTSEVTTLSVPFNVGFDLVSSDQTTWRFVAAGDALTFSKKPTVLVGANWNHVLGEKFRLALGVGAYIGENPLLPYADLLGWEPKKVLILPLPTIEMWWKF
jgi:hypothetical protein